MTFQILRNGEVINTIVGSIGFVSAYCEAKELTFEEVPEPEPEPTPEERIVELEAQNALLTAQVQALSQQNDFQEELIVELANIVYA